MARKGNHRPSQNANMSTSAIPRELQMAENNLIAAQEKLEKVETAKRKKLQGASKQDFAAAQAGVVKATTELAQVKANLAQRIGQPKPQCTCFNSLSMNDGIHWSWQLFQRRTASRSQSRKERLGCDTAPSSSRTRLKVIISPILITQPDSLPTRGRTSPEGIGRERQGRACQA